MWKYESRREPDLCVDMFQIRTVLDLRRLRPRRASVASAGRALLFTYYDIVCDSTHLGEYPLRCACAGYLLLLAR